MIYSVHGKLIAKEPAMAVVECGGVGYACRTTLHTLGQVGNLGETVLLYTATVSYTHLTLPTKRIV